VLKVSHIKFENLEIFNFNGAIRGMRNPLNSWEKYDSMDFVFGPNDKSLAFKLVRAGTEHRKFLRQIMICMDITAPRYWWTEFDTYKIGVTRNSCSTMHKLGDRELTQEDFVRNLPPEILWFLNAQILIFKKSKGLEKTNALEIVKAFLPEGYLQMATVTFNYEVALTIYRQRKNHQLTAWKEFCNWMLENLPYIKEWV
jgi:hypothetical protein